MIGSWKEPGAEWIKRELYSTVLKVDIFIALQEPLQKPLKPCTSSVVSSSWGSSDSATCHVDFCVSWSHRWFYINTISDGKLGLQIKIGHKTKRKSSQASGASLWQSVVHRPVALVHQPRAILFLHCKRGSCPGPRALMSAIDSALR